MSTPAQNYPAISPSILTDGVAGTLPLQQQAAQMGAVAATQIDPSTGLQTPAPSTTVQQPGVGPGQTSPYTPLKLPQVDPGPGVQLPQQEQQGPLGAVSAAGAAAYLGDKVLRGAIAGMQMAQQAKAAQFNKKLAAQTDIYNDQAQQYSDLKNSTGVDWATNGPALKQEYTTLAQKQQQGTATDADIARLQTLDQSRLAYNRVVTSYGTLRDVIGQHLPPQKMKNGKPADDQRTFLQKVTDNQDPVSALRAWYDMSGRLPAMSLYEGQQAHGGAVGSGSVGGVPVAGGGAGAPVGGQPGSPSPSTSTPAPTSTPSTPTAAGTTPPTSVPMPPVFLQNPQVGGLSYNAKLQEQNRIGNLQQNTALTAAEQQSTSAGLENERLSLISQMGGPGWTQEKQDRLDSLNVALGKPGSGLAKVIDEQALRIQNNPLLTQEQKTKQLQELRSKLPASLAVPLQPWGRDEQGYYQVAVDKITHQELGPRDRSHIPPASVVGSLRSNSSDRVVINADGSTAILRNTSTSGTRPAWTPPIQPAPSNGSGPAASTTATSTPSTAQVNGGGSTPYMVLANPKGLVEPGNLPIWNRPVVKNADGTHSSEYSTSFQDDQGHEVLVPTVVNGKFLTPDGTKPPEGSDAEKAMFQAAWQHYLQTGQNLGKFDNPDDADAYAQVLHNRGSQPASVAPPTQWRQAQRQGQLQTQPQSQQQLPRQQTGFDPATLSQPLQFNTPYLQSTPPQAQQTVQSAYSSVAPIVMQAVQINPKAAGITVKQPGVVAGYIEPKFSTPENQAIEQQTKDFHTAQLALQTLKDGDPSSQSLVLSQLVHSATGRFSPMEQKLVMSSAGWVGSIDGLIEHLKTGRLAPQLFAQIVQYAGDNLAASNAALANVRQQLGIQVVNGRRQPIGLGAQSQSGTTTTPVPQPQTGQIKVVDKDGGTHLFKDQASADRYLFLIQQAQQAQQASKGVK